MIRLDISGHTHHDVTHDDLHRRAKLTLSLASFERGTTDPEANALRRQP
ncbi:hypothetical protein [Rhizobium sp. Root1334]|nr:hypothetical protein [Rhizobium sp. Root1334]